MSKSGHGWGSSSHLASLKTVGYSDGQSGVALELLKWLSTAASRVKVLLKSWLLGCQYSAVSFEYRKQLLGQCLNATFPWVQSMSRLCFDNQSCPRMTFCDLVVPRR